MTLGEFIEKLNKNILNKTNNPIYSHDCNIDCLSDFLKELLEKGYIFKIDKLENEDYDFKIKFWK